MNDLIYRQVAIDEIEGVDWYHQNKNGEMVHGANSKEHQPWYKSQDIYKALKAVPAVDAVPVIRCKDCRFSTWYTTFDGTKGCFCGKHGSAGHTEKDFCSYAEREETD